MNKLIKIFLSIFIIFGAQAALGCDYPQRMLVPNGNTAAVEDMLEGQKQVKRYVSEMEIYLDCLEMEENLAREAIVDLQPEDEQEREEVFNKKYNAAVDEMERLAAQFNAEVQAFRAQGN